jgi:hypothetical protein
MGGSLYDPRIADVAAKDHEGFAFEPARRVEDASASCAGTRGPSVLRGTR